MIQEKTVKELISTSIILAIIFIVIASVMVLSIFGIGLIFISTKQNSNYKASQFYEVTAIVFIELIISIFFIFYLLKFRKKMKSFLEDGTFDSLPEVANCINKMFILESLAFGVIVLFILFLKVFPTHF
jgi:hypothetical protein